ncbi:MAG: dTDP-4-dehydrorhamnose 3,5-epimerase [Succinivibrio sp.]|nr:dTDP-4-dehydrorhamnose 3,5-epimerase [Succinivibrio sp.]
MNFIETSIAGVWLIEPRVFHDARGYFFESFNAREFAEHGITANFVQDNQSKSSFGVIRGLHCQTGEFCQAKIVRVLVGKVLDVAVDIRQGSPTFGQHVKYELSEENQRQLYIPRGFLHGFSVLSETAVFAYKVDNFYHKEAEWGMRYDAPELGIDWQVPSESIITSDKDRIEHSLRDVPNFVL